VADIIIEPTCFRQYFPNLSRLFRYLPVRTALRCDSPKGAQDLSKYRRIEVKAYRRRLTVVSGEWPRDVIDAQVAQTDDDVSLTDSDLSEFISQDSPEGQIILVDAVRSLERRLSPQARAMICADRSALDSNDLNRNGFYLKLRSIYGLIPKVLRFTRKEKSNAAKQSVKD
jgi:hypothetical protein